MNTDRFKVPPGRNVTLGDYPTDETTPFRSKEDAAGELDVLRGESAVDVDGATMADMLRGEPVVADATVPQGHVALRYGGDVVGRGRQGAAGLTSEIPKARAKDLLRALAGG